MRQERPVKDGEDRETRPRGEGNRCRAGGTGTTTEDDGTARSWHDATRAGRGVYSGEGEGEGGEGKQRRTRKEGGDRDEAPLFLLSLSLPRGGRVRVAVAELGRRNARLRRSSQATAQQRPKLPALLCFPLRLARRLGSLQLSLPCRLSSLLSLPPVGLLLGRRGEARRGEVR